MACRGESYAGNEHSHRLGDSSATHVWQPHNRALRPNAIEQALQVDELHDLLAQARNDTRRADEDERSRQHQKADADESFEHDDPLAKASFDSQASKDADQASISTFSARVSAARPNVS